MYEDITFEDILDRLLERIPDDMDKREGSVIYDALAPVAFEWLTLYAELESVINDGFADTASMEYLKKRAEERGLFPYPESKAIIQGRFEPETVEIELGERFTCKEFVYVVIEKIADGNYKLESETFGEEVNVTGGELVPVDYIEGLETATVSNLLKPGENEEDVSLFRHRYFESFESNSFGGNIADYKEKVNGINGVGGCKVYPVWNGGGTVKIVIIDSNYNTPSSSLVSEVQEIIDPITNHGKGLGIAPIGHAVTVVGGEDLVLNIETTFTFSSGYEINTAIESLKAALDNYLINIKKLWVTENEIVVRISHIESAFLDCIEIVDVENTTINGSANNIVLSDNEIPKGGLINDL